MFFNNKIIAHRGIFDNKTIVENTKEAFQEAIKKEIPFELDVQLTRDNQLVVFHDKDLKRLANLNNKIENSTYEELKKIRLLDTDATIPLLKDILKLNNDKVFIDIEIKNTKRWKDTIILLMQECKPYMHYVIKSFSPKIIRYIKKNYSWVTAGLLVQKNYTYKHQEAFYKSSIPIWYSNPDFLAVSKALLRTNYKKKMKDRQTLVWTINNLKDIPTKDPYIYICNIPPKK